MIAEKGMIPMQALFLDVTAEQLLRCEALQQIAGQQEITFQNQTQPYIRLCLQAESQEQLEEQLIQIIAAESVPWVLWQERDTLLFLKEKQYINMLEERVQKRLLQLQPQIATLIQHDLHRLLHADGQIRSWNISGYFYFSAKKLKWMVQTLLQEEYQSLHEEHERREFISLLQFCVAVQPSLVENVYLTIDDEQFILLDAWGNDLQALYLESLPEEEYRNVQMNDLLLSILMTMLPQNIHLFVTKTAKQETLLHLLQEIFGPKIVMKDEE